MKWADLPLDLQAKLLRVLQEKEYYRVGGLKKLTADVRLVCATNADLEAKIREGSFRKDLYYRLAVGRIVIPPLRQRPGRNFFVGPDVFGTICPENEPSDEND